MYSCLKKQSSNSMSFKKSFLLKLMFLFRQQTHLCAGEVKLAGWQVQEIQQQFWLTDEKVEQNMCFIVS